MIINLGSAIDLFVHPGEYEFADANFCIRTTLGSCVAITLWHPQLCIGGLCHYMLPQRTRGTARELNGKYASEALELLRVAAREHGTRLEEYQVKLFGGGNMFPGYRDDARSVARRNVEAGRQLAASHGLRVRAQSLGGVGYRNVIFDIASGDVWVRHVGRDDPRVQTAQLA